MCKWGTIHIQGVTHIHTYLRALLPSDRQAHTLSSGVAGHIPQRMSQIEEGGALWMKVSQKDWAEPVIFKRQNGLGVEEGEVRGQGHETHRTREKGR